MQSNRTSEVIRSFSKRKEGQLIILTPSHTTAIAQKYLRMEETLNIVVSNGVCTCGVFKKVKCLQCQCVSALSFDPLTDAQRES